jgi:hypothetical protein
MYALVAMVGCMCPKVVATLSTDQCSLAMLVMQSTTHCQLPLASPWALTASIYMHISTCKTIWF